MKRTSYRESHLGAAQAARLEQTYASHSYDAWIWARQRRFLLELVEQRFDGVPPRYLDVACGTGRVISALEDRVRNPTGIDISEAMLGVARERLSRSTLIHGDPTAGAPGLAGPFDLVTAFRFFLGAEDGLRRDMLRAVHRELDPGGVFVFNVHGNKTSLRYPGVKVRRHLLRRYERELSLRHMRRLLREEGFEVAEIRGFGLLTAKLYRWLGAPAADRLQRLVESVPPLRLACVDLVYVCTKASG